MDVLCGQSSFDPIDGNGNIPLCFLDIALYGFNSLFLFVFGLNRLIVLRSISVQNIKMTKLQLSKIIFCLLIALLLFLRLAINVGLKQPALYSMIGDLQRTLSWLFICVIIWKDYSRALRNTWFSRTFVVVAFILSAFEFQTTVYYYANPFDLIITSLNLCFSTYLAIVLLFLNKLDTEFELLSTNESNSSLLLEDSKINPEGRANFYSRISFSWLNPLLYLGYKRPLDNEDLYELPEDFKAHNLYGLFEKYWLEEKTKPKPSLTRAFTKVFGWKFVQAGFYKVLQDIFVFTGPLLLYNIISFMQSPSTPTWVGFLYALGIFVSSLLQSMFLHQYFHRTFKIGQKIRSTITVTVYNKAFRLSNRAKQGATVGEMVNLQAIDSQRIADLIPYLHMIWSSPEQLIIGMILLWGLLGPSVIAGVAIMILMAPLNAIVIRKLGESSKEMMKIKDKRAKTTNEVLNSIRIIKFFAWEESYIKKVTSLRNVELKTLRYQMFLKALTTFFWTATPILVSFATFVIYALSGNELNAEKAFTALSLFNIIRFPLNMFPNIITSLVEARISMQRLQKFLLNSEIDPNDIVKDPNAPFAVKIENGTFKWDIIKKEEPEKQNPKEKKQKKDKKPPEPVLLEEEVVVLKNISMEIPRGQFAVVIGTVGSGKSSLLSAILGEIPKESGTVTISGSIAYVAQQAWIQNGSLQQNILFGKPYDEARYNEVIRACELTQDLSMLPDGDKTEIGEKGINLSGGQKQRVSLARAVYQNADIYLLDDALSAVDAHVGKNIVQNCLLGLLANKTRILVTHQLQFLRSADYVLVLTEGAITEQGTPEDLMKGGKEFQRLMETHVKEEQPKEKKEKPKMEAQSGTLSSSPVVGGMKQKEAPKKLITSEERQTGHIRASIYKAYIIACGGFLICAGVILIYLIENGARVSNDVWLSYWSSDPTLHSIHFYLVVFSVLGLSASVLVFFRSLSLLKAGLIATKVMHEQVLEKVIYSPTSFYDTTPIGRILNRFTKDTYTLDDSLPRTLGQFLNMLFNSASVLVVIGYVTPIFLTAFLPLSYFYRLIQKYYLESSRELKRLESITKSPIFAQFSETLNGLTTIRSFKSENLFIESNNAKVDLNASAYYVLISSNRWLGMRLEFVGTSVVGLASFFAVIERNSLGAGLAGLSISYALQTTGILNWLVRAFTEVETQMVSMERMMQYTIIESEAPPIIPDNRPPPFWPSQGIIVFQNVKLRYRQNLDLVLKGISFSTLPKEKIGVVGRTGAGKSSLMLAIYRMIELTEGSILIDDIDISKIGLRDLRSKLSIIPQDPTLFTGTIRSNLDPFEEYTDSELWASLGAVHMKRTIEELPDKLESAVSEGGENLSVGQRQLLCLARALIRKSSILIMDEATAAVDFETDSLIQKTIREEFGNVTVLTIAHRINTIMDYNRVLVLDQGLIAEYDSPANLLKNPQGIFYSLVNQQKSLMKN